MTDPRAEKWKRASFEVATRTGVVSVTGVTYNGLGVHFGNSLWWIIHLGSGHEVATLKTSNQALVLEASTILAETMDWSFHGVDGWQNIDPGGPERCRKAMAPYAALIAENVNGANHDVAAEVSRRRA